MSETLRFKTWDELVRDHPGLAPGLSYYGVPVGDSIWDINSKLFGARVELERKPSSVRIFAYHSGVQFDNSCSLDQFAEFRKVILTPKEGFGFEPPTDTAEPKKCDCSWDQVYRYGCNCGGV